MAVSAIDVVFSFDMTRSMTPAMHEVRVQLSQLTTRFFDMTAIPIRIALITHGDYDSTRYLLRTSPFMNSREEIQDYIRTVQNAGSNKWNHGEAYEQVLLHARGMDWNDYAKKILVIIGDDIPHTPGFRHNRDSVDWRDELASLRAMDVEILGIQCPTNEVARAKFFYEEISRPRAPLMMRQFPYVVDFMTAIIYAGIGEESLVEFGEELMQEGRYTQNIHETIGTLLGTGTVAPTLAVAGVTATGLGDPVPDNRFQTLTVDRRCSIREFVQGTGAEFKTGRGFYQLTKSEKVSPKKSVVLYEHATARMYTGPDSRNRLGLDEDNQRLKPRDIPEGFTAFIQSTSVNRTLLPGTTFLYEVSGQS